MVEVVRMVCLNFLVQACSEGGARMLLNAAMCTAGRYAGGKVGDAFILRALGGAGDLRDVREKELKSLKVEGLWVCCW